MSTGLFNLRKALNVFGCSQEELLTKGIHESTLPAFARNTTENRLLKSWSLNELPKVGERVGFMKKPKAPLAASIFITKGGVLKSSLTLNLARMAALHNIRTCVVGLDMQGDVSNALSTEEAASDDLSLDEAIARMNSLKGLADLFTGESKLDEIINPTDIPNLSYIPETPELVALDQSLINRNRREYWLSENVINPLKRKFDLILMDCSPNWNRLITNALMASDVLISPVECKITNFRNMQMFRALIQEFKADMRADFSNIYVPTRLAPSRKLSQDIFAWYEANLPGCTKNAVRESLQGEEAMALRMSIPEYAPTTIAADEMRDLLAEIWQTMISKRDRATKGSRASQGSAKRALDLPR